MEYINSSSTTSNSTSKVQLIRTVIKSGSRWQFEHEFSKNIVLQCLTPHLSFLNCQQADGREKTNVFFLGITSESKNCSKNQNDKTVCSSMGTETLHNELWIVSQRHSWKRFYFNRKNLYRTAKVFLKKKLLRTKVITKNKVMISREMLNVLKSIVKLLSSKNINNQIWLKLIIPVITTTKTFFCRIQTVQMTVERKIWWIFWFVLLSSI